jgi:type VI secretion system secreted protein VgrG
MSPLDGSPDRFVCALSAGFLSPGQIAVVSFRGREALSELYSFDIVARTPLIDGSVERAALGQRALFTIELDGVRRRVHGIIASVRALGTRADQGRVHAVYRLRLVPRAWLLTRRRSSRIFQRMRVDEIVTAILTGMGIASRWLLTKSYPARDYCTQYEETDYAFVRRILAEAGIFFHFEHPPPILEEALGTAATSAATAAIGAAASQLGALGGAPGGPAAAALGHVLPGEIAVFSDDPASYPPIDDHAASELLSSLGAPQGIGVSAFGVQVAVKRPSPPLYLRDGDALVSSAAQSIRRLGKKRSVQPSSAVFHEFDPRRPNVPLVANKHRARPLTSPEGLAESALALAGGAVSNLLEAPLAAVGVDVGLGEDPEETLFARIEPAGLEIYEHHGGHLFPAWDDVHAEPERILKSARRRAHVADGESACVKLAAGRRFRLEEHTLEHLNRDYVVAAIRHRGASGSEPGTGPSYTNHFECVPADVAYVPARPRRRTVQSCLTATVVGPPGEEIHVDAMGQVKVHFHWDRGAAGPELSSCWIRAMQTWSGAAFGSQFIPRVGMEVVVNFEGGDPDKPLILGCVPNGTHPTPFSLPEQRTRSGLRTRSTPSGGSGNELSFEDASGREQVYLYAEKDLDVRVRHHRTVQVDVDSHTVVGGDERRRVDGAFTSEVRRDSAETVLGSRRLRVEGNANEAVQGSADRRVAGDLTTRVEGREHREVTGSLDLVATGDMTTRVAGSAVHLVGRHDAPRSYVLRAEGRAEVSSSQRTEIDSDGEVLLRCGRSSIRLTPTRIEIDAPDVSIRGRGARVRLCDNDVRVRADQNFRVVARCLVLRSEGAAVALGQQCRIDGSDILLNSPEQATDPAPTETSTPTTIELVDDRGNALSYQRFRVALGDGSEVAGVTDGEGRAEIDLEGAGDIYFPDLSDVGPA